MFIYEYIYIYVWIQWTYTNTYTHIYIYIYIIYIYTICIYIYIHIICIYIIYIHYIYTLYKYNIYILYIHVIFIYIIYIICNFVCFSVGKFPYSSNALFRMIILWEKSQAHNSVMSRVLPVAQELEEFWSHEKETAWYRAHPIFKAHPGGLVTASHFCYDWIHVGFFGTYSPVFWQVSSRLWPGEETEPSHVIPLRIFGDGAESQSYLACIRSLNWSWLLGPNGLDHLHFSKSIFGPGN